MINHIKFDTRCGQCHPELDTEWLCWMHWYSKHELFTSLEKIKKSFVNLWDRDTTPQTKDIYAFSITINLDFQKEIVEMLQKEIPARMQQFIKTVILEKLPTIHSLSDDVKNAIRFRLQRDFPERVLSKKEEGLSGYSRGGPSMLDSIKQAMNKPSGMRINHNIK